MVGVLQPATKLPSSQRSTPGQQHRGGAWAWAGYVGGCGCVGASWGGCCDARFLGSENAMMDFSVLLGDRCQGRAGGTLSVASCWGHFSTHRHCWWLWVRWGRWCGTIPEAACSMKALDLPVVLLSMLQLLIITTLGRLGIAATRKRKQITVVVVAKQFCSALLAG